MSDSTPNVPDTTTVSQDIIQTDIMNYITHQPWQALIKHILSNNHAIDIRLENALKYIQERRNDNTIKGVYPPPDKVFAAFNAISSPSNVRVVILGQDPYHQPGQAMGLSFSIPRGITVPPSLRNIYKEQCDDTDLVDITTAAKHGDLTSWANQGVLLLNAALTVEDSKPKSHANKWKLFTDAIIKRLAEQERDIVFMLWGGDAKKKKKLISNYISSNGHLVLEAAHPSPLAANKGGWFGNKHFSKANTYLVGKGYNAINWKN